MVGVQVRTNLRIDARGTLALLAGIEVAPMHAVHVGRRTAKVAEIAFESIHLYDLLDLAKYAFLGTARDELALMGRDGTEGTTAKTAAMDIDAELNHLVGWNTLALIFNMRYARIGQVERGIKFFGSHGRIGRIDDDKRGER